MATLALSVAACSFSAQGTGETESEDSAASTTSAGTTTNTATSSSSGSTSMGSSTSAPDPSTSTSTTTDDSGSTGGPPEQGCPDPLPGPWIYCQDFENLEDPFQEFDPYFIDEDHFEVDDAQAWSGEQSLRIRYSNPGDRWSGEAWVRFGDAGNDGPVYASDRVFYEVWARGYIRTQDDWPGGGYGLVFELSALYGSEAARVAALSVVANPASDTLSMQARSCIIDGSLDCDGEMDWQTDVYLNGFDGQTDVSGSRQGPQWHCVVVHMRLNELGATDGFASLDVDGVRQGVMEGLDLRGTWDQTGINTFRVTSSWNDGASGNLERFVDDVVVSAQELRCD